MGRAAAARLGRAVTSAFREAAHHRLPFHSGWPDSGHPELRAHRLSAPAVYRLIAATAVAGITWAAYSSSSAARRPGLRGQALGRVPGSARRHARHQRLIEAAQRIRSRSQAPPAETAAPHRDSTRPADRPAAGRWRESPHDPHIVCRPPAYAPCGLSLGGREDINVMPSCTVHPGEWAGVARAGRDPLPHSATFR